MTDARYTYTAGMPAARVGWLVARARSVAGIGERDLASSVGVPVRTVRRWERGDLVPTDDEVEGIASACGARLTELLPRRAVVAYDPSTGIMQMGDQAVAIPTTSLDNDTVLAAFVALVRRVRGLRLDQDVKVRQEDLDALGEVLDLDDQELEERLMRIIGMSRSQAAAVRAQLLRKRLAVPMVGMLAGLSLLGVNRLFTTGSEQVKAIDGKVETVFPVPSTTTTTARVAPEGGAAPAATPAPASSSSPTAAPATQAATVDAPAESAAEVTSTTQPFVGPKFPVRTGPPATTPGRRPTTGGETAPTDPPTVGAPVTDPPSSGGGGASPATPVTHPPTSPPTTGQPAVTLPPTVPPTVPVIGTGGPTETTPVTPPPTPPPTTPTTPPVTDPPPPPTTATTVPPIDVGHTTETTPPPPPPPPPSTPTTQPTIISGIGTTGSDPGTK